MGGKLGRKTWEENARGKRERGALGKIAGGKRWKNRKREGSAGKNKQKGSVREKCGSESQEEIARGKAFGKIAKRKC